VVHGTDQRKVYLGHLPITSCPRGTGYYSRMDITLQTRHMRVKLNLEPYRQHIIMAEYRRQIHSINIRVTTNAIMVPIATYIIHINQFTIAITDSLEVVPVAMIYPHRLTVKVFLI
jgi:hypothetical protein